MDIFLPDGGDVLRPDLSVILEDNYPIIKRHIHGAPDLVCEILSESTEKRDLGEKADRYLTNGIKEYWIINPKNLTIQVWKNRECKRWEKSDGNLLESEIIPGFRVDSTEVFE